MFNETKTWKLQIYAERAWRLAMDIAIEGGKLGKRGGGIAVVANETRHIANKLYLNLESIKKGGIIDVDFSDTLERLNMLTQNGYIEMMRINEYAPYNRDTIGVAVIVEEIRIVTYGLMELFEYQKIKFIELPEITCFSSVTDIGLFLLQVSVGRNAFVENIRYIQEIISYADGDTTIFNFKERIINLRGMKIPVVDCYSKFGLTRPSPVGNDARYFVIIVNTDWDEPNKLFAVLVDDIASNSIFRTKLGVSVPSKSGIFSDKFVRECWNAAGDKQVLFMDWRKLSE